MSEIKQMMKIYKLLNINGIKKNSEYIEEIIKKYNLGSESKFTKITEKPINNYYYKIYHQKKEKKPDWVELILPLLNKENLFNEKNSYNNVYNSVNIFIYNDSSIYLITKGHGNHFLRNYVDSQFGVDIALRIANEYNEINSLSEVNMFGKVKNEDIEYRNKENFIGIDNFGKKINNLNINLKIENIQYLGDNLGILDSNLEASSYFLLRRSITFDQVIEFIKNFDKILLKKPIFETSLIEIRGKEQKREVINHFCENIKDYINSRDGNNVNYFEFMSAKISEYKLDKYYLRYNKKKIKLEDLNFKKIIEIIELLGIENLEVIKIIGCSDDDEIIFETLLIEKLGGKVEVNNKYYYILEGKIYIVKNTFFEDLNRRSNEVRKNIYKDEYKLPITWGKEYEGEFNKRFENGNFENYFSYDKETRIFGNIEICDILQINDENKELIFYHIKERFNQSMRDLGYQIEMASNLIAKDNESGEYNVAKQMYMIKKNEFKCNEEEFITKFKNYKIIFCMGIKSGVTQSLEFDDMEKFTSGVAKFALLETEKNVRMRNFQLFMVEV